MRLLLVTVYLYVQFHLSVSQIHNKDLDNQLAYKETINKLITQLDVDFTKYWIYKDLYNKPEHIGVTPSRVQKALANLGDQTQLKLLLLKALSGEKIDLVLIGGSITKGAPFAESGKGYRVYFNAIRNWWNMAFSSVTGSRMTSQSVSIGGVGTDYFAYCLNSHIREDEQPKLVLWELSANDRGRFDDKPYPSAQPLEQFTRNVLQRKSKPTLFHIHFFRGHDYMGGLCRNFEDEGGMLVAKHYQITSISWRNFVCQSMKEKIPMFSEKSIFAVDRLHPSILGHAQMAFLVINHLKNSFLRMLRNHALHTPSLSIFKKETLQKGEVPLASILYHETSIRRPICFTYFQYNDYQPNNTLAIEILRHDDFHFNIFKKFAIRQDKLGGLQTFIGEQLLIIAFTLPSAYSRLVITTHSSTGNGKVWIDKDTPVLIETQNYSMGTKVELVTTNLNPGRHLLNVLSMQNGFAVCAVAVI